MTHFLFRPFTFTNEEKKNENNLDGYDFNGFYVHFVVVVHCVVLEPHCKWNCCKYGYDCTQSEQLCFNAIDASFFVSSLLGPQTLSEWTFVKQDYEVRPMPSKRKVFKDLIEYNF